MGGFVRGEGVSGSGAAGAAAFAVMSPVVVEVSDEGFYGLRRGRPGGRWAS